jgi:K+-sensing histidine kinase KdpD
MTPKQQAEIIRRARRAAERQRAGWSVPACPFNDQSEADLYRETFELAMKEGRK